jgi:membrane protease YdiL (CAAX protease family)
MLPTFDPFAGKRPSFLFNTIVLAIMMALYLLSGQVLLFVLGESGTDAAVLFSPASARRMFSSILLVQGGAQLLLLALPVLLLAAMHTRSRNPFSGGSLAFLGIGALPDARAVFLAVAGIFLLQPLLHTVSSLQELYLWPALGDAGAAVVSQQQQMDAFIRELAQARSVPGFLAVAFVLAIVPALSEELLFRGYIQKNYAATVSPRFAVILTGLAFAFFHLSPANLLPLALLGWFIGYIYAQSGNLSVPVLVHFVNNLAALTTLFFTGGSASAPEVSQPERLLGSTWWWGGVAVSLLLFMAVLRRFSLICLSGQSDRDTDTAAG